MRNLNLEMNHKSGLVINETECIRLLPDVIRSAALILSILMIGSVTGLCAYLYSSEQKINEMSYGTNIIKVEEVFEDNGINYGDNYYRKRVTVRNVGSVPCYVRVFLGFGDGDMEEKTEFSPDGENFYTIEEYQNNTPAEDWSYDPEDGYYYYKNILACGEETSALIDTLMSSFHYDFEVSDIYVYAESVQIRDMNGNLYEGDDAWTQAWKV